MSKSNLRDVVRLVALFTLVFALSLAQGWADSIGTGTINPPDPLLDVSAGQVSIYNGGFIPVGDTATNFNWFGPTFSGSRELTPLIFTESGGVFTVVGIGAQEIDVSYTGSPESFAFGLQAGTATASAAGTYTFGFVEGLADSTGSVSSASTGSIGHDNSVDAGLGAGGAGTTNDWVFTPTVGGISVGIGETFVIPGSNATGDIPLNNPGLGGNNLDRTYSANITASSSGVAEPGTFSLITGAGLVLAGLFRYRYSRGRG
jgi:hypothetical protein